VKILFIGLARVIWLFDLAALNPRGESFQKVIEGITKKYQFVKAPQNLADLVEKKALSFTAGTFLNPKGVSVLVTLNIYPDGFVVDTMSSTNDSTAFLAELMTWLTKEFGLQVPPNIRKGFVSQIDFECDVPMTKLNSKLEQFIKSIESVVRTADRKAWHFDVGAINFWTEDVSSTSAPAMVKFERKISAPFAANHYFSQAPVETDSHKQLLDEFESILKS
jgi:hypothetical protein